MYLRSSGCLFAPMNPSVSTYASPRMRIMTPKKNTFAMMNRNHVRTIDDLMVIKTEAVKFIAFVKYTSNMYRKSSPAESRVVNVNETFPLGAEVSEIFSCSFVYICTIVSEKEKYPNIRIVCMKISSV